MVPAPSQSTGLTFGLPTPWKARSPVSAQQPTQWSRLGVGSEPSGLRGVGAVLVADSAGNALSEVNQPTGQVTDEPLVSAPFGVAVGERSVWVTNPGSDEVTRLARGAPPVEFSVGSGPTAVIFAFGSAWVANGLDSTVSRIDPATDSVDATIAVGDGPDALTVAGGSLWVANRLSSTLSRIDPASDSVSATLPVGASPLALAAWGRRVWAATGGAVGRPVGWAHFAWVQSVPTLSIDPALAYGYEPAQFYEGTYDTLLTFQRTGGEEGLQIVPDLALAMPTVSDGGTQYSFVLRPGLRYSNGQLVRPEDFRRAIRARPRARLGRPAWLSRGIVGAGLEAATAPATSTGGSRYRASPTWSCSTSPRPTLTSWTI